MSKHKINFKTLTKLIIPMAIIILSLVFVIENYTLAYYSDVKETPFAISIENLTYEITSESSSYNATNNQITVPQGTTDVDIKIQSLNSIDTNYKLTHKVISGEGKVEYYEGTENEGTIAKYDTTNTNDEKTIELVLTNNQTQNLTVELYLNSGYIDQPIEVANGSEDIDVYVESDSNIIVDLEDGMIPIKWDGTKWVKADSTNTDNDWYDYENFKWANMALVTNSSRSTLQSAAPGAEVSMDKIEAIYVYIPRYKYKLWNAENGSRNEQEIEIEFEKKRTTKSTGNQNGEWLTHPAFTFGSNELNGIWVGKFETSADPTSECYETPNETNCNVTNINPKVKPNVDSWRFIKISNMFINAKKFKTYGLSDTNVDSHMMKNMEWGAVAYLSHSKYGKYKNPSYIGANKEIYINNYQKDGTTNATMTGCSAGAPGSDSTPLSTTCAYKYHEEGTGTGASTTGTIYGIYDMSGGAWDYIMGNAKDSSGRFYLSNSDFTSAPEDKYYDSYEYSDSFLTHKRGKLGDATKEILKAFGENIDGWYSNYAFFPYSGDPWFLRGGNADSRTGAGVFGYSGSNGDVSGWSSTRSVLAKTGA